MQKTFLLLGCLLATNFSSFAQNVWHKRLPSIPFNADYTHLSTDGEAYFLHSHRDFFQMDKLGAVTGHFDQAQPIFIFRYWTSVIKKYSPVTGHPYFLVAWRQGSTSTTYTLEEYRPGVGFVNQFVCADSLGSIGSGPRLSVVETSDSTIVVFGRQFYRKLKYAQTTGFSEEWVRPLNAPVKTALWHNNLLILANEANAVMALDESGNQVWSQNHPAIFRALKVLSDGFIGCGRSADNKAVLMKLDFNGSEIWKRETSDHEYWDVVPTAGGGYAVTGVSEFSDIILATTTSDGTQIWKKEYGNGTGVNVLQDDDGGYVLAGRGMGPNNFKLIKTNGEGHTTDPEEVFIANRRLKTNGIQATLAASPSLFFDGSDATLISPADSAAAILSFAPWIGGLDDNDNLHIAAADYAPVNDRDYEPGLTNGKKPDLDQVWKISREEIADLRRDFGMDQILDAPVPFDLLTWPAKGNPHLLFNLDFTPVGTDPSLFPAPFEDANGDGIYNIYNGDYPLIKGDQMAWWMLTDSVEHKRTNGRVIGVDLLISAYTFDCPQNGSVDKSLFVDFEVINRSATNYHDTYMGFFTDFDLGCYHDDYLGTMPDANAFYVYNQDALDTDCNPGIPGFGEEIPVQTAAFLNQSLDRSMYFNNGSVGNSLPGTQEPDLPIEFYHYLQSKWKDGTTLTTGGVGYNLGSTNFTNHVFPDNPPDPNGWSMCSENLTGIADRRMISSHGPINFAAGNTFKITVAFTLHPDIAHPCPDVFSLVKPAVEQIKQWNDDGALVATTNLPEVVNLPSGQSILLDASVPANASYLWSSGATTPSITVTQAGEYTVTVTPATGCPIVENVLVQLATSVQQPAFLPTWKIQPNPAGDFVLADCPECGHENLDFVLRNAQGAALRHWQEQKHPARLEMRDLPSGFYWLEMWQEGRFLGSKKLVLTGN